MTALSVCAASAFHETHGRPRQQACGVYSGLMNLKAVAETARQHIYDLFAADLPCDIRLETWLYGHHFMGWSLPFGFTPSKDERASRTRKLVRVSEADKSVLSVRD